MRINKILKLMTSLVEIGARLVLFLIGAGVLLAIAYYLGYFYLQEIRGNDTFSALNIIHWLARWWPKIPYWYPGQGGGVSFIWGYPMLASFMVLILSFWQKINLTVAFKILGFLSLPLTAVGMSLFVWRRLKNQTVGLVGAVFYLLMPLSWTWLFDWGFYAEAVACIFIFPTLLFYDRFLEGFIEKKINRTSRISLLLTVVFLGLTFAAHPAVFFGVIRIIGIYSPIYFLLKRKKLKSFLAGLIPVFLVFLLAVLGTLFLIGNFQYYASFAKMSGGPTLLGKEDFIATTSIPFDSLLGSEILLPGDFKFAVRNAVVPMLVWLPAIIGTALALFFSIKVFSLALASWISLLFLYKMEIPYFFIAKLPLAGYFVGMRTETLILRMILPIVAAFGIWAIPGLILKILTFWLRFKNEFLKWGLGTIKGVIAGVITLGMAGFLIYYFADYPAGLWQRDELSYGPDTYPDIYGESLNIRDPFYYYDQSPHSPDRLPDLGSQRKVDLWKEAGLALLDKNYWPKPDLTNDFFVPYTRSGAFPYVALKEFNEQFGNDQFLRLDVSPTSGGVTQTLNIYNQASMVNLYAITLNLLGPYWGHQQQVAFTENDGRVETAEEIAKWFGTRFLIYNRGADGMDKYKDSDNWEDWDKQEIGLGVLEYKKAPQLWTLTEDKPMVLMIGDLEKRAYEPVFRASNKGALPYDDFWLVQGKEYLDSYSLAELEKFDILMLFGYHYKSQRKAFNLLEKYLKNGGAAFISSGWQYVDQVWEGQNLPEFFPVETLSWTDEFGQGDAYQLDKSLIGEVNMDSFGPLRWGEKGWGVSVGSGLRPWAKSILAVNDRSLVTGGEYEKGKVVLSGLNIVGHMHNYNYNQSEKDLFRKIFEWLSSPATKDLTSIITASRDFPDQIEFTFSQATEKEPAFYFRESFFPSWKAKLIKKEKRIPIKIYRAGPGFKLMKLPKLAAGDTLILEFKPGFRHLFLQIVSVATFLGLAAYFILGKKLYQPLVVWFSGRFKKIKSKAKTAKESWGKEEEY